jgi:hypothetical protein
LLFSGVVGLLAALGGFAALASVGGQVPHPVLSRAEAAAAYGRLPLSFEQNRGQAAAGVAFAARGPGWTLGLGRSGVDLSLAQGRGSATVVRVTTQGGRLRAPVAEQRLPGRVSYFVGRGRSAWVSGAPTFARIVYRDVWPGVDLAFHGRQGTLEYDLGLAPGADPGRVALRFAGARAVRSDGHGGAVVALPGGSVRVPAPRAEQGTRRVVSRLVVSGDAVRVALGAYDHARRLVVDPDLVYSTYLSGIGGCCATPRVAIDPGGDAYVTGVAAGGFPTTPGAYQTGYSGGSGDVFVAKLNSMGSALVYSTYLGGSGFDESDGIALDSAGDAYITGSTRSGDFPTTPGAYQPGYGGAFVAKLNPAGSRLVYSTYLGGNDGGLGIAVDPAGDAYITGVTLGAFPTTPGAYQTSSTHGGGFVAKLDPTGSSLVYSTYLPDGGGNGIALDSAGDAYVIDGGTNLTKLNPTGSGLIYSVSLGPVGHGIPGSRDSAIAVDSAGDAYITGSTLPGFPTTPGAYQTCFGGGGVDAFVAKLNPTGSGLVYSTYLGGSSGDGGSAIAIDSRGDAYVTGFTGSRDFPTTPGADQPGYGGSARENAFVAKIDPTGSALLYSTYLGGSGLEGDAGGGIAVDAAGDAYVTGSTDSRDFPTTPGAYLTSNANGDDDAFVTKLSLGIETPWAQHVSSRTVALVGGPVNVHVDNHAACLHGVQPIQALRVSARTFALTGRRVNGRCVQAARADRHHPLCPRPISLRISYQLALPEQVRITITQQLPGRLVKGSCATPTHRNRKHRPCTRSVPVPGNLTSSLQTGSHSLIFNGQIGDHQLTAGRYQLTAIPTLDGQSGSPQTVTITITS